MNSRNGFAVLSERELYAVNGGSNKLDLVNIALGVGGVILATACTGPVACGVGYLAGFIGTAGSIQSYCETNVKASGRPGCVDSNNELRSGGYTYSYNSSTKTASPKKDSSRTSRDESSGGSSRSSGGSDK